MLGDMIPQDRQGDEGDEQLGQPARDHDLARLAVRTFLPAPQPRQELDLGPLQGHLQLVQDPPPPRGSPQCVNRAVAGHQLATPVPNPHQSRHLARIGLAQIGFRISQMSSASLPFSR